MNETLESPVAEAPVETSYWKETRQPIYSAAVVLPFLIAYEVGLLLLRSDEINGGDAILLNLGGPIVRWLGLGAGSASMVALAAFFIGAQVHRKGSWKLRPQLLASMFFESLVYAVILFMLLGYLVQYLPHSSSLNMPRPALAEERVVRKAPVKRGAEGNAPAPAAKTRSAPRPTMREFILYCGAGVYEELVFRVILLGLLSLVFNKLFHMESAYAAVWSVVAGAIIFSGFHHIGGEPFFVGIFLQRVFAGLYFAAIYYNRSFGLAAASHAMYDILIGLNQWTRG
jgi:hypothetical protein